MVKSIIYFVLLFFIPTVYAGAQNDPYGRVDAHNLGSINQQDYEISVLTTYRQNIPRVDTGANIKNSNNIDMKNIQDIRPSIPSIFDRYDVDRDGRLNREEFRRIEDLVVTKSFDAVDLNKDGYVSQDELMHAVKDDEQSRLKKKTETEKSARQKHDEAYPTLRVLYDETEGYYVR